MSKLSYGTFTESVSDFRRMFEGMRDPYQLTEKRSKEDQLRGLQRTTGHIGNPALGKESGEYTEPNPVPKRTRPAPKKGWDPHPGKVRQHRAVEKEAGQEMAKAVARRSRFRKDDPAAKAIKALRVIRDAPSAKKDRKAEAAKRLPIKFPDKKNESIDTGNAMHSVREIREALMAFHGLAEGGPSRGSKHWRQQLFLSKTKNLPGGKKVGKEAKREAGVARAEAEVGKFPKGYRQQHVRDAALAGAREGARQVVGRPPRKTGDRRRSEVRGDG